MLKFSDRFRIFYPYRSEKEISEKLQEMISKKQFKVDGEEEYWRKIEGQGLGYEVMPSLPRNSMDMKRMEMELDMML
jgi:hypothetical protein